MPLFNHENAAIIGRRGALARWTRPPQLAIPDPLPPPLPTDEYANKALARTRSQLDLCAQCILDELQRKSPDSRRLRDLSDAQAKLAEQERILSGRPLPGSRNPSKETKEKPVDYWTTRPAFSVLPDPAYQVSAADVSAPAVVTDSTACPTCSTEPMVKGQVQAQTQEGKGISLAAPTVPTPPTPIPAG